MTTASRPFTFPTGARMSESGQSGRAALDSVNTPEEVAAFAKVSPRTVVRAIAAGKLEALRAGAQLRITDRAVWAWLESRDD
jgi:excisionase family DNA binding protein